MSNVLSEGKKEQVIALGRLGWSLRRIEKTVHIRRETISGYLKAAGIPVRPPGSWGRRTPAKPANEVITDFGVESTDENAVAADQVPGPLPSASACEPWREVIQLALSRGRNAKAIWQDLVDDHSFTAGYQSVRRFVGKLRGSSSPEARVVIITPPGEDYGESGVMVRRGGDRLLARARPLACVFLALHNALTEIRATRSGPREEPSLAV